MPILFANGVPVVAVAGETTPSVSTAKVETNSFDFIVSGAQDRLKGLTVASMRNDKDSMDEKREGADGEITPTGIAVVDAPDSVRQPYFYTPLNISRSSRERYTVCRHSSASWLCPHQPSSLESEI